MVKLNGKPVYFLRRNCRKQLFSNNSCFAACCKRTWIDAYSYVITLRYKHNHDRALALRARKLCSNDTVQNGRTCLRTQYKKACIKKNSFDGKCFTGLNPCCSRLCKRNSYSSEYSFEEMQRMNGLIEIYVQQ